MKLRVTTMADKAALDRLISDSYRELLKSDYSEAVLEAALPKMERANPHLLQSGTYYLVEEDGAVAGCGGWSPDKPGTGEIEVGIGHIRHFATHPDFTGRGVGRMLVERCLEEARQAQIETLYAFSTLTAVAFYEALGFERIRSFDVEFAGGVLLPSVEMIREV